MRPFVKLNRKVTNNYDEIVRLKTQEYKLYLNFGENIIQKCDYFYCIL